MSPDPRGAAAMDAWHLYVLRCADGTLYTGVATDVARRVEEHAGGRGARYLRGRGPLQLVFAAPAGDHSAALRAEHRVKRLDRAAKEAWLASGAGLEVLERDDGDAHRADT